MFSPPASRCSFGPPTLEFGLVAFPISFQSSDSIIEGPDAATTRSAGVVVKPLVAFAHHLSQGGAGAFALGGFRLEHLFWLTIARLSGGKRAGKPSRVPRRQEFAILARVTLTAFAAPNRALQSELGLRPLPSVRAWYSCPTPGTTLAGHARAAQGRPNDFRQPGLSRACPQGSC